MNDLQHLFGSQSRVMILKLFLNTSISEYNVNQVVRAAKVNAKMVSSELKNLESLDIIHSHQAGNNVFYALNPLSPFVQPLKDIFADHEWSQWERPSRIHHLVLTLEASLKPMQAYYGTHWPEAHLIFNYDNVTWFFKPHEFIDLGKQLLPIYLKRKNEIWTDFDKYAARIPTFDNYADFYDNYVNFWKVAYIPELISFYLDTLLKPGEQITINDQSFTQTYEDLLWRLAKEAKQIGINKVDLSPILQNFFWIRNSYYGIHRLTEEEVRTEIKKKMDKVKPKPPKIPTPTSLSIELLQVGKDMILMQDKRKMYMMQGAFYLHQLLKETGVKYNLSPSLMQQTVPQEVLHADTYLPHLKDELKMRLRSCSITGNITDGIQVFSGQSLPPSGTSMVTKTEIRGQVACGGKAVGRAKIIKNVDDLYMINHGDIIVSPMTSPELMPAIRRCVAIVTDFGGMTCHAAIVAREFNIPCIVGTTTATEIIHNQDLIEVDANSGIIRILQTAT